mmetsp:Transcript_33211/g.100098  ORF Transcript_33211/g.100098 Transcript_33211/m.100098 type:complete len:126 (+) Transcript_33211:544-921(+)
MALNQSFGSSPLEFATNALLPAPWGGLEPESAKQPRVSSPIAQKKFSHRVGRRRRQDLVEKQNVVRDTKFGVDSKGAALPNLFTSTSARRRNRRFASRGIDANACVQAIISVLLVLIIALWLAGY